MTSQNIISGQNTKTLTSPPTFTLICRSEAIKLTSIRSTIWCLSAFAAILLLAAGLVAYHEIQNLPGHFEWTGKEAEGLSYSITHLLGIDPAQILVLVMGVLSGAGEFSAKTIRSSFAATPRRGQFLAAKATVVTTVIFAVTVVILFMCWALAAFVFSSHGQKGPMDGNTVAVICGAAGYMALIAVFGFGIGVALRSTAAGISVSMGVAFVLPILLDFLSSALKNPKIMDWAPTVSGTVLYSPSQWGQPDSLPMVFAFVAWIAAAIIAGAASLTQRDV